MKIGFRTPNLKKRLRARTTGKIKRKAKKMINPFYGKKGIGFIKNPSRSIKNSIYHKVTVDPINLTTSNIKKNFKELNSVENLNYNKKTALILCSLGFIGLGGIHDFYLGKFGSGIVKLLTINWFLFGTIIDLVKLSNDSY